MQNVYINKNTGQKIYADRAFSAEEVERLNLEEVSVVKNASMKSGKNVVKKSKKKEN